MNSMAGRRAGHPLFGTRVSARLPKF